MIGTPTPTSRPPGSQSTIRSNTFYVLLAAYALSGFFLYAFLHNNYRPDDVDDGWHSSYCYNYFNHGIVTDQCFGDPHNGIRFFGKINAVIVGVLLNTLGWTRTNGHLFSMILMFASLGLWFVLLRRLRFSLELSLSFVAIALLTDCFFSAAISARSESFNFLLATLALFLFMKENYFLSVLTAWLAIETHPIGTMAFVYIAAAYFWDPARHSGIFTTRRRAILLVAGLILGAAGFLFLHAEAFGQMIEVLRDKNFTNETGGHALGPFYEYFFETRYYRHLPELGLFLVALFIFFKTGLHKSEKKVWVLLLATAAVSLVIHRPNFHYTLFFYPALLLLTLRVFELQGGLKPLLIFLLALLIPQYGLVYWKNRTFDYDREIQTLRKAVPNDGLPVVASGTYWFAFYDRTFYHHRYWTGLKGLELKKFYLIEDGQYRGKLVKDRDWLESHFASETIAALSINDKKYLVRKMSPGPP